MGTDGHTAAAAARGGSPDVVRSSIDTRFFPQPARTRVALYPPWFLPPGWAGSGSRASAAEAELAALTAHHYAVPPSHVHLTSSGAAALALLLGWLAEQGRAPLRVAMPAFCCPSVVEAILAAGATPVFLDVGALGPGDGGPLGLMASSIEFAASAGCRVLIWPQLFGARDLGDRVNLCTARGLWLVSDEAQSFPATVTGSGAPLARIFSFGPAKLLAGLGGGGLVVPHADHAAELAGYVARRAVATEPGTGTVRRLRDAALQSFVTRSTRRRRLAERLRLVRPLRPDLRELLEATGVRPVVPARISPLAGSAAAWLVRNRQTLVSRVRARAEALAENVTAAAGPAPLACLEGLRGAPSVYALAIAPEQRHAIGAALAAHGIQTTWFYYPLNRLGHLAGFPSEPTPNTDELAARTLILPLRWQHTARDMATLGHALGRVLSVERSRAGAPS